LIGLLDRDLSRNNGINGHRVRRGNEIPKAGARLSRTASI